MKGLKFNRIADQKSDFRDGNAIRETGWNPTLLIATVKKISGFLMLFILFFMMGCDNGEERADLPPKYESSTIATGLPGAMGMDVDADGNVWVAITGTANNDGKVVVVRQSSGSVAVKDAVINLASIPNALTHETEGPSHLLLDAGNLYVLAGDFLYTINISGFHPGNTPIDASVLPHEDIGTYVRSLNIVTPNDSHPYNLIKDPDGKIYIVDAGANAIIKRESAGNYSVLATFPTIPNPTTVGPPQLQAVPTGIMFDGNDFLVSTLIGFPFPEGKASIYKVSTAGHVSLWKEGYTALVDIAPGYFEGPMVLQIGLPGGGEFLPNTGELQLADKTALVSKLNMPSALKQIDNNNWYITTLTGSLIKVTRD